MNGLSSLFEKVTAAATSCPGWCDAQKACTLASIVVASRPHTSVEIGIYGGSSFFPIALAHKEVGFGKVIGIEPWSKDVAIANQTTNEDREWWANQNYEKLRSDFFQRLREYQLEDFAHIIQNQSRYVEPPPMISFLHVDGSHSDEAIADVVKFSPRVEVGGFVILDDLSWAGGGVTRSEQRLLQLGFKKLYLLGTGACYQRVR